jgi:hypothetical protein
MSVRRHETGQKTNGTFRFTVKHRHFPSVELPRPHHHSNTIHNGTRVVIVLRFPGSDETLKTAFFIVAIVLIRHVKQKG